MQRDESWLPPQELPYSPSPPFEEAPVDVILPHVPGHQPAPLLRHLGRLDHSLVER